MSRQRISCFILVFFLFVSLAFSQNLAEVAKKEKERRDSLKGKKSIVVTNADLKKVTRQPSVSVVQSPSAAVPNPEESQEPRSVPTREEDYSPPRMDSRNSREPTYSVEESENPAETVEMLTRKMNYLQQKFYTFTDWTLRDEIQREIVQTYEKLQKAQEAEKKSGDKKGRQRIKNDD
jgi:hypothetical protein